MLEIKKGDLMDGQDDKQAASIMISDHFCTQDHQSLDYLLYAEYDIIYNSFEMKHAAYLQKKLAIKSKRQQNQEIERRFLALSVKNHKKISQQNSLVTRLLNKVEFQWNRKNFPIFHQFYFQKYIDNNLRNYIESLERVLTNEQKMIKSNVHIIYSIQRAIEARQQCLHELRIFLSRLDQSDINDYLNQCKLRVAYFVTRKEKEEYEIQGYKINKVLDNKIQKSIFQATKMQELGQIFRHLTRLTIRVIQLILKWRQYIYSLTPEISKKKQQVEYYYEQQNYLLRIINDNSFIQYSFLNKFFKFSSKNDPFLLMPLLNIEKQQKSLTNIQALTRLQYLKKIFAPKTQSDLQEILYKVKVLAYEYQKNIQIRKVFDLRGIHQTQNINYQSSSQLYNRKIRLLPLTSTQQSQQSNSVGLQNRVFSLKKSKSFKINELNSTKIVKNLSLLNDDKKRQSYQSRNTLIRLSNVGKSKQNFSQTKLPKFSNPQNIDTFEKREQQISSKLRNLSQVNIIKEEVKRKIKQNLNLNKKLNLISQKLEFTDFIQSQVQKQLLQTKFQQNFCQDHAERTFRNTKMKNNLLEKLFVETYSIQQSQLLSHIQFLCVHETLLQYRYMQPSKNKLLYGKEEHADKHQYLENLQNIYFLKVKEKSSTGLEQNKGLDKVLSNIIFTVKHNKGSTIQSRKLKFSREIQIFYVSIKFSKTFNLQRVILKCVQFLFKYEKAESILFRFYYDQKNPIQSQNLSQLKAVLESQSCKVTQKPFNNKRSQAIKQSEKNIIEISFRFSRKDISKIQIDNKKKPVSQNLSLTNPLAINVGLYGLLCEKSLKTESNCEEQKNQRYLTETNYDYLLTEIIKNHIDSDDFLTLKNNATWQHRLRVILENIIALKQRENNQQSVPFLQVQSANSILQLNRLNNLGQKKLWSVDDSLQQNKTIKMFQLELKLSLPYIAQAFINRNGVSQFRFQIRQRLQILNLTYSSSFKQKLQSDPTVHEQKIYVLPCLQKKNVMIGLFDAGELAQFIQNQNQQILKSEQKKFPLTIADLLNRISICDTQHYGKSMRLVARSAQYVRNLYIPMFSRSTLSRKNETEPTQSNTINTIKCKDFQSIHKDQSGQFLISDSVSWKYPVFLQSGIRYNSQRQNNDITFSTQTKQKNSQYSKMGLVLFLVPEFIVIYSKIL